MANESELLAQIEELQAALAEAKDRPWQRVREICHDLKLPLTSIKGYVDLLPLMGTVNDAQKDSLVRIKKNVVRMGNMLTYLHDMAILEQGKFVVKSALLPTLDLLKEIEPDLERLVAERQHILVLDLPEGLPAVLADRERFIQILKILVENASWYTPQGGQITVKAEPSDSTVRITVADTGIGVPEDEREKLFQDLFFRGASPAVREHPGGGMSLYMLRYFVEFMQGSYGAEFPAEGGSRFWFQLPATGS